MRATELVTRQLGTINQILHDVADDLTPAELVTRALSHTNLIAFDLWHVARVLDWAAQTMGRGVTGAQADALAHGLALADLLEYADATHQSVLAWLRDLPARLARYPVYLETAMRAEVPWMFQQPPLWRCLAPAIGHNRDHLAQIDLLKRQLRARQS
jgi:hypothetical protein